MTQITCQFKFLSNLCLNRSMAHRTTTLLRQDIVCRNWLQDSQKYFHNISLKYAALNESNQASYSNSDLLSSKNKSAGYVITRSLRRVPETVPSYKGIEIPPEKQKLPAMPKLPPLPTVMRKMPMAGYLLRGEEEVHTDFIHRQYGIVAEQGGFMRHGHFEMIRKIVNAKLNPKKMFAIWRIDSPWKAHSKKGIGKRMGMGKGNISFYTTPVKAKRVIIEVAGKCSFKEVQPFLKTIAHCLPFRASVMTQQAIEEDRLVEERLEKENKNPFTFKYILQNNMLGSQMWAKRYIDMKYFGKYD